MAQKVAEMDVRMAAALASGPANVAGFCRAAGISRQTFYKWRTRFAEDGLDGLEPRSRAPLRHPGATSPDMEDALVRCRKQLQDAGRDFGPQSVLWELEREGIPAEQLPSRATVARILFRRGLVVPQPKKRPKCSLQRFTYPRPNSCWQSDWTRWWLADGSEVGIAGSLDDHSRYCVALRAGAGNGTGDLVWQVFTAGIAECGIPAKSLSDNGSEYTARLRGGEADFERNLRALGVEVINSRPHHPQTCGKIERFWQTLKRWLRKQPPAACLDELNEQLERFRHYYNHERRHRALPRHCTPAQAFAATEPARPADRPLPAPVLISVQPVRNGRVTVGGRYFVSIGRRWTGHTAHVITDGDHITVFIGTRLIRELDADPTRQTQPLPAREPYGAREPAQHQPTDQPQPSNPPRHAGKRTSARATRWRQPTP